MAKLQSDLTHIALMAPELALEALHETADDINDLTKQLSPVDTGRLRDSYHVEQVNQTTVQVGSDVEYAPYVEYGTVHSPAQPHLTPSFAQNEATFKARLAEKMRGLG